MTKPQWSDTGEPLNLEAAAFDALRWLQTMADLMDAGKLTLKRHDENRQRLTRCIERIWQFAEEQ